LNLDIQDGSNMLHSSDTSSRLSLLRGQCEYSARSDTCIGESTLDKARDSVELYVKKTQKFKQSEEVSVEKTQRQKSFNSWISNISPRVLYERATITSRDTSEVSFFSEGGFGKGFSWSSPLLSLTTDTFKVLPMTKVHPNLYIGNEDNSNDADLLNSKGITHILSLIGHQSSVGKVVRKQYVMHDKGRSDIKDVLDEVYEFMESGQKENNNLLVHCKLGQNRSAVVVIAFLMKKFKKTLHRAHRDLRKVRPIIQVNVDYAKQLLELEREYLGKNSLPPNWMEREYNEAANDVVYKHEDLTTLRQSTMFANVDNKQNS